jgi:hypothetical protein
MTYDITFTGTGILPTAGSFTYDSTNPAFSDFMTWDVFPIWLTGSANDPDKEGSVPWLSGSGLDHIGGDPASPVPEPGSLPLLATPLCACAYLVRIRIVQGLRQAARADFPSPREGYRFAPG